MSVRDSNRLATSKSMISFSKNGMGLLTVALKELGLSGLSRMSWAMNRG